MLHIPAGSAHRHKPSVLGEDIVRYVLTELNEPRCLHRAAERGGSRATADRLERGPPGHCRLTRCEHRGVNFFATILR